MKTLIAAILLLSVAQAQAITCASSRAPVSDDYLYVAVNESSIEVRLWESGFKLAERQYKTVRGSTSFANQRVKYNVEGMEDKAVVSGKLAYKVSDGAIDMIVDLSIDGYSVAKKRRLSCWQ